MSVFQRAIIDADGHTVNVGYLSLFWIMIVVLNVIPLMCVAAGYAIVLEPASTVEILKALGAAVGMVAGGFATTLGALGLFLWGDSKAGHFERQSAQTSSGPQVDSATP